jgi:hypothetical protein
MPFRAVYPNLFAKAVALEQIDQGATPNDSQEKTNCP